MGYYYFVLLWGYVACAVHAASSAPNSFSWEYPLKGGNKKSFGEKATKQQGSDLQKKSINCLQAV